jgi:hypothetical protein
MVFIQEHRSDAVPGSPVIPAAPQQNENRAIVERVELAYFLPQLDSVLPAACPADGPCTVQPVWRFSGNLGQRVRFEAHVQAIRDEHLSYPSGSQDTC